MKSNEVFHEERDSRGIDHLVVTRTGRCATFQHCAHEPQESE